MTKIEATVCGIPCLVGVTYWEPYQRGRYCGPPEKCYPPEGGRGEWKILDRKGRPAPWLERKMTDQDRDMVNEEVFNHMENYDD
jgi:hypothetical protein